MQLIDKPRKLIALIFSVPFTSIGAMMSLWIVPGVIGQTVLIICQVWLLFLPIIWLLKIERKPLKISQSRRFDWITGIAIGLLMFGIILTVYWLVTK